MQKVRIAVCIRDGEYQNRFTNCLVGHFGSQFELHLFTDPDQLKQEPDGKFDLLLLGDFPEEAREIGANRQEKVLYLLDYENPGEVNQESFENIVLLEKYQEVNHIVEVMLREVGDELMEVKALGFLPQRTRKLGIYSLSQQEYQLPFAVTLGSLLAENERVLLVDLQENSGLGQLITKEEGASLEEVLVMAASGKFVKSRLMSCIGHLDRMDFLYPASNSECICEADRQTYQKLFHMLVTELDYDTILINFGSRFVGFFETLSDMNQLFLMKKGSGISSWREQEFMDEMAGRGLEGLGGLFQEVELPQELSTNMTCERLVEQWKWNEFGDMIRGMNRVGAACG